MFRFFHNSRFGKKHFPKAPWRMYSVPHQTVTMEEFGFLFIQAAMLLK